MPWSPKQHRLFCARCNDGKGPKDMCRMCHEGIKDDSEGKAMQEHLDKKRSRRKRK